MLKVMIVDDEPTTLQGLVTLIPWEIYGFEVVGTARKGNDALKKFQTLLPDVMIVDIMMPGITGIELIRRIREQNSSVVIIILSGHAEFEFAQQAMKYNVKGYLLKPIDEDELIHHLQEVEKAVEENDEYLELKVKMIQEKKEALLLDAIKGVNSLKLNHFLKHDMKWNMYKLILVKPYGDIYYLSDIKETFIDYFEQTNSGFVFMYDSKIGILLNSEHMLARQEEHLFAKVQKICHEHMTNFTAAISESFDDMECLQEVFEKIVAIAERQFFYQEGVLLHERLKPIFEIEKDTCSEEEKLNLPLIVDKLLLAMEIGDKQAINRILTEIAQQIVNRNASESEMKTNFIQIISSLLNKLMYVYQDIRETIGNVLSKVFEIEKQPNISKLILFVNELLSEIIEKMDVNDSNILVKKMIILIESNYEKNIKLETLAEILNYNRGYLGKIFKNETGVHFNTYLDKVRIENGKKLLLQGLKVYQVAERIGFSNVDYFHSKFKKYVGMSPSKFRKHHQIDKA